MLDWVTFVDWKDIEGRKKQYRVTRERDDSRLDKSDKVECNDVWYVSDYISLYALIADIYNKWEKALTLTWGEVLNITATNHVSCH